MKIKLPDFLPFDKWKHLFVGLIMFFPLWAFFTIEIALLVVICVAFLKEVYDTFIKKTGFDFGDFVITFIIPFIIYQINSIINH